MNAASSIASSVSGGAVVRTARAWDRFWFAPADPTTLGLIRLLAGFLTLYVHLAYCADLQEFFGKDAWLSLETANLQRHGTPWSGPPAGWTPPSPTIVIPTDTAGRAMVMDYVATLMDRPAEKQKFLDFLAGRLKEEPDWGAFPPPAFLLNIETVDPYGRERTTRFLNGLPKDRAERAHILEYIKEWGIDPRMTSQEGVYAFSLWFHLSNPTGMAFAQGLILLVTLMFAVGFCTRITSVLTWLAAISYLQRSPITLFGADTMMNILLLYLMIGPSGSALSVDRLLVHWWANRKSGSRSLPPPPTPSVSANFALRLIQVHFCFIYFAAGTSKLLGGNWWNGTAIYFTMANYEFAPLRYEYYSTMLRWLCRHRWLWELVMEGGSFFTVGLEISLPLLVWNRRLRPYLVGASMLLHTMIALTMGLAVFSLLMATLVMSFLPGESLQRWLARLRHVRPVPPPPSPFAEKPAPAPSSWQESVVAGERPA